MTRRAADTILTSVNTHCESVVELGGAPVLMIDGSRKGTDIPALGSPIIEGKVLVGSSAFTWELSWIPGSGAANGVSKAASLAGGGEAKAGVAWRDAGTNGDGSREESAGKGGSVRRPIIFAYSNATKTT